MKARPYQDACIAAVEAAWLTHQSCLVVMPTGTGKTVTFANIIRYRQQQLYGRKWMVIAHREELVRQAVNKLDACGLRVEIEMAQERAGRSLYSNADVIVASIQTLVRRGLRFDPNEFAGVIVDEAHHYVSASWRAYIDHLRKNKDLKIVGVTATPDRADKAALGAIFETVAFEYDLPSATNDGWLVPIETSLVHINGWNYSKCRTTAGDLNARDQADTMDAEKVLGPIAKTIVEHAGDRRTLIFAQPGYRSEGGDTFKISERLREIMLRYTSARIGIVSDETPKDERRELLREYADGRIQFMVNVGVLAEGFDDPGIRLIALARKTKSRSLFTQWVGRGTRPLTGLVDRYDTAEDRRMAIAESAKPSVEILDFEGNAGNHKLVSTIDALAGDQPPEVISLAEQMMRRAKHPMTTAQAIADAKQKLADDRRRDEEARERARQEAIQKRAEIRGQVNYSIRTINPFDILDIAPDRPSQAAGAEPATDGQIGFLQKFGVPTEGISKREASRMIAKVLERKRSGLCTFKQAAALKKLGHDPTDVTFQEASDIIGAAKGNPDAWRTGARRAAVI